MATTTVIMATSANVHVTRVVYEHSNILSRTRANAPLCSLLDFSEEAVEMTNENIKAGDLVRVVKGSLRGMEGELIRHKGVTKVLVRIDMLGCAMVNIPASFVEKLNK